jgi:hypothetical protein
MNLLKARMNESAVKSGTNSMWIALVFAQVNCRDVAFVHFCPSIYIVNIQRTCKIYTDFWKGWIIWVIWHSKILSSVRVSRIPLCFTVSWQFRITSSVKWCFLSNNTGTFVSYGNVAFMSFASVNAASNSYRGIFSFNGATPVFDANSCAVTPFDVVTTKYTLAPYAI